MFPVKRLRGLIREFADKRIVVVGDLIADEYLYGKPARISREAPVLILRFTDREVRLGGAANAAHNVHALGATALPIGVLGADPAGDEVLRLFGEAGIPSEGVSRTAGRLTPVKTRIMARHQQVARYDRETDEDFADAIGELANMISENAKKDFGDVQHAVEALEQVYRNRGYTTVSVLLPEQALEGGEVLLQVIEGRIRTVKVEGQVYFDHANIRASLPELKEGKAPNLRKMSEAIQLANENPARQLNSTDALTQLNRPWSRATLRSLASR